MTRVFEARPAVRERVPLLVGLVGPSGTGKTYSALRLATGMQRVCGGDVYLVDTEARRALHYADQFRFHHVPFGAPFSPADYLEAIEYCIAKGARTVVIDSMSHEHEGPGGVLEMFDAELYRLAGDDYKKAERMKMLAWQKPKKQRQRLINSLLQRECNFLFCFRAKEKIKPRKGDDPEQLGWQPIAGPEFVYEMMLKLLFLPGARGVPVLAPQHDAEKQMVKVPGQFERLFAQPRQVTEDIGEQLAQWAAGGAALVATCDELAQSYAACSDAATMRTLEAQRQQLWTRVAAEEKAKLKKASDAAKERVEQAAAELALGSAQASSTEAAP